MSRFLIVGLGSIGRRHTANLKEIDPAAKFTFLRSSLVPDEFFERHQGRIITDLAEVSLTDFDLAVVASPSARHIDVLPQLISAGVPLVVEKPVVTEMDECDYLLDLLAQAPTAQRIAGFNLRYLPSLQLGKNYLESGLLGNVVRAHLEAGQWLPDWRPGINYAESYSAHRTQGGGVELDLSHEFDLARWWFGELDVDFVRAGSFSGLEIEASDTAVAMLSPEGRAFPPICVSLDYVCRRRVRRYSVVGDRGRLEWDIDGSLQLVLATGEITEVSEPQSFDVAKTYRCMMQSILSQSGNQEPQPLSDGIASTRLALQVRAFGGLV